MTQPQSITSLPEHPDVERRRRLIRYTLAMSLRVACVMACLFVQGWWLVLPVIGALVLPYVAVVVANVVVKEPTAQVLRPGALVRVSDSGREP